MLRSNQLIFVFTESFSEKIECVICGCGCVQPLQLLDKERLCTTVKTMLDNIRPDFLTSDSSSQVGG